LGGRVDIESEPGVGTCMRVRLPLTLAILDGMSVAVGDQLYILPLACVLESLQATAQDIRTMGNQTHLVQVRGGVSAGCGAARNVQFAVGLAGFFTRHHGCARC